MQMQQKLFFAPTVLITNMEHCVACSPCHPSCKFKAFTDLIFIFLLQGELASFIDAQVRESQTKKTFDALKDKVHGLAVRW